MASVIPYPIDERLSGWLEAHLIRARAARPEVLPRLAPLRRD